jgi:GTP cyclohydrolase II
VEATGLRAVASVRVRVPIVVERLDGTRVSAEAVTFHGLSDGREHLALVFGPVDGVPLVRLHSECLTGDVFGSTRCDCGRQLSEAVERFADEGGVLLYLRQEGRGIGLYEKLDAYVLQDQGYDTFRANQLLGHASDERDYRVAAEMLAMLGIPSIRLLSNNPDKARQLERSGIDVVETIATRVYVTPENRRYLQAKSRQGGHTISLLNGVGGPFADGDEAVAG